MAPMKNKCLRIGLASLMLPETIPQGVAKVVAALEKAASKHVDIVCFPEAYIPGLRGMSHIKLPPPDQEAQQKALKQIREAAGRLEVAVVIGMEWVTEKGLENRAFVIAASGRILGHQTKNQITPGGESKSYVPDGKRRNFSCKGVKFGIAICHEGWRYPETVRWAAVRGAKIVFQPQVTINEKPVKPKKWGSSFYERAMVCRSEENSIYFASVNTATPYQNSATSVISPTGECISHLPCNREDLLIADIDVSKATGRYAKRYKPELYP